MSIKKKEIIGEFKKDLDNIFILGRGQSLARCPTKKPEKTEYWGCNNIYKVREVDRLFIMHNIYDIQFNQDKDLIKDVNKKDLPVYTLGKYEELKNNIAYPMEEIIKKFGISYFLNSISYILPLTIMQKPKNIILFGVDMSFGAKIEYMKKEKACLEFWIGVAIGRGINVQITQESTLLKRLGRNAFYGMKFIQKSKNEKVILVPDYKWDRPECAEKYKIVKVTNFF